MFPAQRRETNGRFIARLTGISIIANHIDHCKSDVTCARLLSNGGGGTDGPVRSAAPGENQWRSDLSFLERDF